MVTWQYSASTVLQHLQSLHMTHVTILRMICLFLPAPYIPLVSEGLRVINTVMAFFSPNLEFDNQIVDNVFCRKEGRLRFWLRLLRLLKLLRLMRLLRLLRLMRLMRLLRLIRLLRLLRLL